MLVIPALDLKGGRCVRLFQGRADRETAYSNFPEEVARQWESLGARLLHVIDLDGALSGRGGNTAAVAAISGAIKIPFQLGGGMRSRASLEAAFALGAWRVILGTLIVEQPQLVQALAREYAGRLVAGIDARRGKIAVNGWTGKTEIKAVDLACRVVQWGFEEIIYTDIEQDGTLRGPNWSGLEVLLERCPVPVILAGGIGSREDLRRLRDYRGRVKGVIIGQALYRNRLTLPEAMAEVGAGSGWEKKGTGLGVDEETGTDVGPGTEVEQDDDRRR